VPSPSRVLCGRAGMLISRSSRPRQKMTIHRVETTNQIMPGRRNSKSPPCRTNRDKDGAPRKLVRPRERLGQPPEAERSPAPAWPGKRPTLATPLLRFQRVELRQTNREAALYPSQPGQKGTGAKPGGAGLEQFPALPHRSREDSRDRVTLDRSQAGAHGSFAN